MVDRIAAAEGGRRGQEERLAAAGADAPEGTAAEPAPAEAEVTERDDLLFGATLGAIYHRSREAACDAMHRAGLALTIFLSTGAVAALATRSGLATGISIAVALVSAANLAFDFAGAARRHRDLRRPYHDIAAEIATTPDAGLPGLRARLIRAAAEAPPPMCGAQALAFNAAARSLGRDERAGFALTLRQRLLAHVLPMTGATFARRG
ncbi:MAG: hypothetical protein HZA68_05070 [Rhodovulum sp.]|nr:hypothetical protein [Rhodovulum sp.]